MDVRRKTFGQEVTRAFAFLIEDYGAHAPAISDAGKPNYPIDLTAIYICAGFTVTVEVWSGYGGESRVRTTVSDQDIARNWPESVRDGAATGFQMRKSLAAQAEALHKILRQAK